MRGKSTRCFIVILAVACMLTNILLPKERSLAETTEEQTVVLDGSQPIDPWQYQKLLGKGMDVDWCKTSQGMNSYNAKVTNHFKLSGVNHVRIRIKDTISDKLLTTLDKQISDCLENGVIPVIAYQADEFKNAPTEDNIQKVVSWWSTIANRYKDTSYLLAFLTNPYLSYKGRPISVASNAICNTPCSFASFTSKSNVLIAIPCLLYSGAVYIFIIYAFLPVGL